MIVLHPLHGSPGWAEGLGAEASPRVASKGRNQRAKASPVLLDLLEVKLESLFDYVVQGLREGTERGDGTKGSEVLECGGE